MIVADVMSRTVVAISQNAPLVQAVRLMVDHHISGIPVINAEGRPVGMLTEGDLLRRVETGTSDQASGWFANFFRPGHLAGEYVQTHGRLVSEVMTPTVTSVEENTPLSDVVALMKRYRIKRLPVVRADKLVGIVSRADLMRVVGEALDTAAMTADDATIRQHLFGEMARQPWVNKNAIGIAVENGVVMIDGCVTDIRERDAMSVLAENVPGVKRVDNRLACVDMTSGLVFLGLNGQSESSNGNHSPR